MNDSELKALAHVFNIPCHIPTDEEIEKRVAEKMEKLFPAGWYDDILADISRQLEEGLKW